MKSNSFSHLLRQASPCEKLQIFNKGIFSDSIPFQQTHKSIAVFQPLQIYQFMWVNVTAEYCWNPPYSNISVTMMNTTWPQRCSLVCWGFWSLVLFCFILSMTDYRKQEEKPSLKSGMCSPPYPPTVQPMINTFSLLQYPNIFFQLTLTTERKI